MHSGKHDYYINGDDWNNIQPALLRSDEPSIGYEFLIDAQERYRQGDLRMAIVQLNAGIEWAAKEFVELQLTGKIPAKSIETILKSNYHSILENWILHLARNLSIDLETTGEWIAIHEIKDRRNEVHPRVKSKRHPLTDERFFDLVGLAMQVMEKLLNLKPPKRPGPFESGCNYDDLPTFFLFDK